VDAGLARLAAQNAQLNGLSARVSSAVLDVAAPARAFAAAGLGPESVARVLMNPPFNDPARQRASPDRRRRLAHAGPVGALAVWIKTAARLLRPRGTLTMIWRAGRLAEGFAALAPGLRAANLVPVPPGEGPSGNPRAGAGDEGKPRAPRAAAGLRAQRPCGTPDGASRIGAARRRGLAAD